MGDFEGAVPIRVGSVLSRLLQPIDRHSFHMSSGAVGREGSGHVINPPSMKLRHIAFQVMCIAFRIESTRNGKMI